MTAGRPFRGGLRGVDAGLDLPLPRRNRLLQEMEADLDGIRCRLMAGGLDPDAAARRAEEIALPDSVTARTLASTHASLFQRVTRGLPLGRRRRAERTLLLLVAAVVVGVHLGALTTRLSLADASLFLWAVVAVGALTVGLAAALATRLAFLDGRHHPSGGLGVLLGAAALALGLGGAGAMVESYAVLEALAADPVNPGARLMAAVANISELLAAAILTAMCGALLWFVLAQRVAMALATRQELLGLVPGTSPIIPTLDQDASS